MYSVFFLFVVLFSSFKKSDGDALCFFFFILFCLLLCTTVGVIKVVWKTNVFVFYLRNATPILFLETRLFVFSLVIAFFFINK